MASVKTSVPTAREERIKAEAYRLWLEEGRPDGRAEAHWFMAARLVDAPAAPRSKKSPVKAKVAKPAVKARKPTAK